MVNSSSGLRVLGLCGSLRPTSKTLVVLSAVMNTLVAAGVAGEALELSALPLPLFNGYSYEADERHNLEHLRARFASHDIVLLASPEYHGAVSGSLKNALDHLPEGSLAGKLVGLIGVADGSVSPVATTTQLRSVVRALGGIAAPGELLVTRSKSIFGLEGTLSDPHHLDRIGRFTTQLLSLAAQLQTSPARVGV